MEEISFDTDAALLEEIHKVLSRNGIDQEELQILSSEGTDLGTYTGSLIPYLVIARRLKNHRVWLRLKSHSEKTLCGLSFDAEKFTLHLL